MGNYVSASSEPGDPHQRMRIHADTERPPPTTSHPKSWHPKPCWSCPQAQITQVSIVPHLRGLQGLRELVPGTGGRLISNLLSHEGAIFKAAEIHTVYESWAPRFWGVGVGTQVPHMLGKELTTKLYFQTGPRVVERVPERWSPDQARPQPMGKAQQ